MQSKILQEMEERKQQLLDELQNVEDQIFQMETQYLESTQNIGNAVKGWEGLINQKQSATKKPQQKVKQKERIFSGCSVSRNQENTVRK